ncbi:molybdopterin cofactor-binding domain-containing protein, partial [Clostridioides difficile]
MFPISLTGYFSSHPISFLPLIIHSSSAQLAAKALNTSIDRISVYTGDTDMCPYDTGAYASCTTYVTGNAT